MSKKFYGFIRLSNCYHESPACPSLAHALRSPGVEMHEYDTEAAAAKKHMVRCRQCLGQNVRHIENHTIPISDKQLETLTFMVQIYEKTKKPMTLKQISTKRKKSIVSTYLIVRKLRSLGLAGNQHPIGFAKSKPTSIVPTELGIKTVEADPVEDLRVLS